MQAPQTPPPVIMAPHQLELELELPAPLAPPGSHRCACSAELLSLLVLGWAAPASSPVAAADVSVTRLGGAWSNYVYRVSHPSLPPLLLRVYGGRRAEADVVAPPPLFSRAAELEVAQLVARLGLGPRLHAVFSNGRLEEFLTSPAGDQLQPLTSAQLREPGVSACVGRRLAHFHSATSELRRDCRLWARLAEWQALAEAAAASLPAQPSWLQPVLRACPGRAAALHAALSGWSASGRPGSGDVLAHADVQHMNVLAAPGGEVRDVILIDYEYALCAPAAYDIGNHFCECAADYGGGEGDKMLDYRGRYPGAAARAAFCAAYLGEGASAGDAEGLAEAAHAHACVSHLMWGLWGVVQAGRSQIEWDFLGYAKERFDELELRSA